MNKDELTIVNKILSDNNFTNAIKEAYDKNSQTILLTGLNNFFKYIDKDDDLLKTNIKVNLMNILNIEDSFKKEIIIHDNLNGIVYFRDCEVLKNLTEYGEEIQNIPGKTSTCHLGSKFTVEEKPIYLCNNFIFFNKVIIKTDILYKEYELNFVTDTMSNNFKKYSNKINNFIQIGINL